MPKPRQSKRAGNVMALMALLLPIMAGLGAFAVDLGHIEYSRTGLQAAADAGALATAPELPGDQATLDALALWYATQNVPPNASVRVTVEGGTWDSASATFTPTALSAANAVRVIVERPNTGLFLGPLLGTSEVDITARAVATYHYYLCGPLVGVEWASVAGSAQTDSYDSGEGPYHSGIARDRGSLCSDGPISVEGSAHVRGDARAGKGYQVSISGGATVTGDIGSRRKPLNLPPVDASQAATHNDNDQIPGIVTGNSSASPIDDEGNFLLDGAKTLDLPPGTFYFKDFTVEGQATLNITGETTIYVTGNLRRAGGATVNNNTQKAGALRFLMTGGTAKVTSNNDFYGVIYAPETAVTLDGGGDLFGAVVGRTLKMTGSGFAHYDEALERSQTMFPRRLSLVD